VLGRPTQERQGGESHEGPTTFTPRHFEGNRERGGRCPTVKERVVSRKSRRTKAFRFGEDRYAQGASSTWPNQEMDNRTPERCTRPRGKQHVPSLATLGGQCDPDGNLRSPEGTGSNKTELRLPDEPHAARQLKAMVGGSEGGGKRCPRPPECWVAAVGFHERHLTPITWTSPNGPQCFGSSYLPVLRAGPRRTIGTSPSSDDVDWPQGLQLYRSLVRLVPRYHYPPIISIEGATDSQLVPAVRQRRRTEALLVSLDNEEWTAPTRCEGWDVADVVAHLISVNTFWTLSITQGLAGTPTHYLEYFDPTVTPGELVAGMRGMPPFDLLNQLVASNDVLLDLIGHLDSAGWSKVAECPVGHFPRRLVIQHGLWDGWIHERDIALPLNRRTPVESDEVISSLVYATALGSAIALIRGESLMGEFALTTNDPATKWVVDVTEGVAVRPGDAASTSPTLGGAAVDLAEALSLRVPLPSGAPKEWRHLLEGGLMAAFGG
jgi:uncharacterized protein (TIGR03083 family)